MRRSNRRWSSKERLRPERLGVVLVLSCLGVAVFGCVSSETHRESIQRNDQLGVENARLEKRIEGLEASARSLNEELESVLEQHEDLALEQAKCVEETNRLRMSESRLGTRLADQSVELVRSQQELDTARAELDRLTSTYTTLMSDLEAEVASGQIQIEQLREGIRVNVSDDILFASGSTQLDPVGQAVLTKVAAQLSELDHDIQVQGHTDDRKLRGTLRQQFPSNWELAAARAGEVIRLFQRSGIDGERLTLISFASYDPIASNDDPDDRAQNRRIEIRLKPKARSIAAPVSPPVSEAE